MTIWELVAVIIAGGSLVMAGVVAATLAIIGKVQQRSMIRAWEKSGSQEKVRQRVCREISDDEGGRG
jgi:hypothetical protein